MSLDTTWCGPTNPTRMALDRDTQLLYVTSPLDHEIVAYDLAGNIVTLIETAGPPAAICLADSGHLLVSVGRSVRKITTTGEVVTTYGLADDYFVDPHDIARTPEGVVYVADDDDLIKVFDDSGTPLYSFGGHGYFPQTLDEPVAMVYHAGTNELIVNDQNNYRMKAFSAGGSYLRQWGAEGSGYLHDAHYFRAFGMDIDEAGRIWTLDVLLSLFEVYDSSGVFLFSSLIDALQIRGGLDIAIADDKAYVTSPSLGCVFVYTIVGLTPPPPPRPFELTILWKDDGLQLLWNAQPGAISYQIERSTDIEFAPANIELLGTTTDTTYMDDLADNVQSLYYYRVTAETAVSGGSAARNEMLAREIRDGLDTEHDSPHHVTHGVNCNSCHLLPFTEPSPRPEWWDTDHLCKSCHVETGFAKAMQTHLGGDTLTCTVCHSPHYQQEQFPHYFINNINPVNESEPMHFNHETDFVHGAPDYNGICEICHTQTSYYRNNATGDHTHHAGSDCVICHRHENGFYPSAGGGACNSCHGAPPATGAHLQHYGGTAEQASYGTSVNLSTSDSYIFSCGTCHPSSSSYHQNGTVDVELYDAGAPNGSLKALNPPSANYTPGTGTCSNVYCHSATDWASTPVSDPLIGMDDLPILDANRNLTYDPYQVTTFREYADVTWNGGALDCNGCHRDNPQTSYPTVEAGVGNSHSWIDDFGYEDLHAWNMASDPLTCRVCHYGTVTAEQTWSRNLWDVTTYNDVPVANKTLHVNGHKDVQFDPVNGGTVRDTTFSLAAATYNASDRTCSSVPCHLTQPEPEWGKPYRWWNEVECDQCHNYSGAFGSGIILENTHPAMNGQSCSRCHDAHPHG